MVFLLQQTHLVLSLFYKQHRIKPDSLKERVGEASR